MCGRFWALVGTRLSFAFSSPPVVISLLTSSFSPSKNPHLSLSLSLFILYSYQKHSIAQSILRYNDQRVLSEGSSALSSLCQIYVTSHTDGSESRLLVTLHRSKSSFLHNNNNPFIPLEEKIELQSLLMLSSRLTPIRCWFCCA
jgi:hypothetical protein